MRRRRISPLSRATGAVREWNRRMLEMADDGTRRGTRWGRGACAFVPSMTAIGGLGHTLPYLIPDFWTATFLAFAVVIVELGVISWIRWRYMDTPFLAATFQVMFGGALVFAAGILIGSS